MKPLLKIGGWLLGGVLLTGAIISIAANQNKVTQLRAEKGELLKSNGEMAQMKAENAELDRLRAENEEVQKLRLANKDLPKLRNEVQQLRSQLQEADKLRAENERLKAASTGIASIQAVMSNRFPKESLRDVGFAVPRATLETFYFAMSRGDINRMLDCLTPDAAEKLRAIPEDQLRQSPEFNAPFIGYEIVNRNQSAPGEVVLSIRLTATGDTRDLRFVQVQNEWKLAP